MPAQSARFSGRHQGVGICATTRRKGSPIRTGRHGRRCHGQIDEQVAEELRSRGAKIRNMNLGEMEIVARVDADPRPRTAPEPAGRGICLARYRSGRLGTGQCGCGQKDCQATGASGFDPVSRIASLPNEMLTPSRFPCGTRIWRRTVAGLPQSTDSQASFSALGWAGSGAYRAQLEQASLNGSRNAPMSST